MGSVCVCGIRTTNGVAGAGLGWTLLLEVAPEIDTNPTSFYRGLGGGVGGWSVRLRFS